MHYFDLERQVRTNPEFHAALSTTLQEAAAVYPRARGNPTLSRAYFDLIGSVYRACRFNPVLLAPIIFPQFPKDKPLSFRRYPFAFQMFAMMVEGYTVFRGSRQISKCRPVSASEPVISENGMPLYPKDLQVGQRLLAVDDHCCRSFDRIVAIHSTGRQTIYKITFRSGRSLRLTGGHHLRTFNGWTEVQHLRPGNKVASLTAGGIFNNRLLRRDRIGLTAFMLGDGCTVHGNFSFTKLHPRVLKEFEELAQPLQTLPVLTIPKQGTKAVALRLSRKNLLAAWLVEDGLWGKHSYERFLPGWVFDLSEEDSRYFVRCLWSTDGNIHVDRKGVPHITYTSTSESLVVGLRSLLSKFDLNTSITTGIGQCNGKQQRRYWVLRIKGRASWEKFVKLFPDIPGRPITHVKIKSTVSNNNDDVLPTESFNLLNEIRKACQNIPGAAFKPNGLTLRRAYNPGREKLHRYLKHAIRYAPNHPATKQLKHWLEVADVEWQGIKSIEVEGIEDTWDIETEKHHNYILDGFISHNSTSMSARQVLNGLMIPGFTSTYICPRSQYLETYADRLRDIYSAYRSFKEDHKLRNNLYYKEFPNRSRIRLLHVLASAANVRSKSTDELLFDEYQDFDPDLELEVMQSQSASETPVTIYAGTSLTTNTALEEKFTHSSQGFWVSQCSNGHFNVPLPEHGIMDMIKPQGPSCAKCGVLLDMSAGYYEHAFPSRLAEHRVGFHIPQIIVPAVYENTTRWREILELKQRGDIRKFNQEVLGIPSEEGEREITRRHLQLMCTLGDDLGKLAQMARSGDCYEHIISGFDWGGSDYDPGRKIKASSTVHVILGVKGDGSMDILHIRRYQGMKYDDIAADFRLEHENYAARYSASDFGVGHYYNDKIRDFQDPSRHFVFHYASNSGALIGEIATNVAGYNHWNLNRTDSLSQLYGAIRTQRIRCFSWEKSEEFLNDFLNLYRVPHEGPGGVTKFVYVGHPARWNDTLHAVNFAFQMGRLLLGEPISNFIGLSQWVSEQSTSRAGGFGAGEHLEAFSG